MPDLFGHPARPLRRELEGGPGLGCPVEDAVTHTHRFFDGFVCNLFGVSGQYLQPWDGVYAEAAQVIAQVAPGVQVPVVAVMHQALWRHLTLGGLAVLPAKVPDFQALPGQGGGSYRLEGFGLHHPLAGVHDADAAGHIQAGEAVLGHQLAQALLERLELGAQQPRFELLQQLLDGDQGQQLLLVEPQARQFGVVVALAQGVATGITVKLDGHMQLVTQLGDVSLESGARDFQPRHQILGRHGPAPDQQAFVLVQPHHLTHGQSAS